MQIAEELEKVYMERFANLDTETERYRSEYNKLRYEYSFLKSEYEHDKVEQQRILEEMKLQHEAEVNIAVQALGYSPFEIKAACAIIFSKTGNLSRVGGCKHNSSNTLTFKIHETEIPIERGEIAFRRLQEG
jgi:hypothetical protein